MGGVLSLKWQFMMHDEMMSINPFGHKGVGDLSGVSEMFSHQPHSPQDDA
jgi:hypothetical protein